MKIVFLIAVTLLLPFSLLAQEMDCDVTFTNLEALTPEARDNLSDFIPQIKQYVNGYRWTQVDLGGMKIKCTFNIALQGGNTNNHYTAQVFVGSQRPIYKDPAGRNTAAIRLLDDKWEFDYIRSQSFSHNDQRFDPLLSFFDYYVYLMLGYDFDSYKLGDGTPYFQKAMNIISLAQNGGKGWTLGAQNTYTRAQLIEEIIDPKYQDVRESIYRYHYRGLDLLYKNEVKARANILAALEKIGLLRKKITEQSLYIKIFFDTKYMEIADIFGKEEDKSVFQKLTAIDPAHQKTYDEYAEK